ncbi:MAG TPA: hypothetical protein VNX29_01950 [Kaistia sp.]|nr:hypothetical protein [Kaistia sp.]
MSPVPYSPVPPPSERLRVAAAIDALHAAFGAPGDYGYGTPKGDALFALYRLRAELETPAEIEQLSRSAAACERAAARDGALREIVADCARDLRSEEARRIVALNSIGASDAH